MAVALALPSDVADLWRPLTAAEQQRVANLIDKASALLRQRLPWVDARIARFEADSSDAGGLNPDAVANVVATVVKRFLVNQDGATNTSETVGPYTLSKGFALRGDKDVRGELIIIDTDLEALKPAVLNQPRLGTLRTGARLAPRFGGVVTEQSVAADVYGSGLGTPDGWVIQDPGY